MRLLPTPSTLLWREGSWLLPSPLPISGDSAAARLLSDRLGITAGISTTNADDAPGGVVFTLDETLPEEAYTLVVNGQGVRIASGGDRGAIWAVETLLQLLPTQVFGPGPMDSADLLVQHVEIADRPRYAWRGVMIDVARHFLPLDFLMRHLEVMAMHKLNVLHLHLTDDQGWRMPVAKYPLLTTVGATRPGSFRGHQRWEIPMEQLEAHPHDGRPHSGAYTQADLKALVARARDLGITVVPEIDMPGHMEAAIAAYPNLGACDHVRHPRTMWGISEHILRLDDGAVEFCKDVLDAAMEIFDGPIHIGGDECPGGEWFEDPASSATLERIGATTAAQAQAWFTGQICDHIVACGREVVAWDEVLEGGAPEGTVVMAWRNRDKIQEGVAAGLDVVAAPVEYTYFDYSQYDAPGQPLAIGGPLSLERTAGLTSELTGLAPEETTRIRGGSFQLWTEYVRTPARAEENLWPRGSSIAQQLWAGDAGEADTISGLGRHLDRLTAAGVNWCRPPLTTAGD